MFLLLLLFLLILIFLIILTASSLLDPVLLVELVVELLPDLFLPLLVVVHVEIDVSQLASGGLRLGLSLGGLKGDIA